MLLVLLSVRKILYSRCFQNFVGCLNPTLDYSKSKGLEISQFYEPVFFHQMGVLDTFSYLRACRYSGSSFWKILQEIAKVSQKNVTSRAPKKVQFSKVALLFILLQNYTRTPIYYGVLKTSSLVHYVSSSPLLWRTSSTHILYNYEHLPNVKNMSKHKRRPSQRIQLEKYKYRFGWLPCT